MSCGAKRHECGLHSKACTVCGEPVHGCQVGGWDVGRVRYSVHRGPCADELFGRFAVATGKEAPRNRLVLSLFPGLGLLDRAFEEGGFTIVRGPDAVWGGDVKTFTPPAGVFEGVIGGPPCQVFSTMRNMPIRERSGKDSRRRVRHGAKKVNLILEFERCVSAAAPWWFVMENVPKAPMAVVDGYAIWRACLHNRDFGAVQMRKRAWCFGVRGAAAPVSLWRWLEMEALHCVEKERAVLASSTPGPSVRKYRTADGRTKAEPIMSGAGWRGVNRAAELQGLPPDFTEGLPFTCEGLHMLLGNGVPLHMGRAVAKAVRDGRNCGFGLEGARGDLG